MAKREHNWTGFRRIGDVQSEAGALFMATKEGLVDLRTEVVVEAARAKGVRVTEQLRAAFRKFAQRDQAALEAEIRERGVPDKIRRLFDSSRKKDKKKLCKRLVITSEDFEALVHNCGQIGLAHRTKNIEFVPDEIEPTGEEFDAFVRPKTPGKINAAARRFLVKLKARFQQRRCVTVHMFEGDGAWQYFYFTYRDMFPNRVDGSNHWSQGTHVHYVCHDWKGWTADRVWDALEDRRVPFSGLHVKFCDEE